MKIYIDSVIEDKIEKCVQTNLIDGITTTPTFFVKSGVDPFDFYKKMGDKYPNLDLQVELMGDSPEEMNENLSKLLELNIPNLTFKTPISMETCTFVSNNRDKRFNVHLVYTPAQAIFAAKSGATFVCPLLGRYDDNGYDGVELYHNIKTSLNNNNFKNVMVMASSIRTTNHFSRLVLRNCVDVITFPPDVFFKCVNNLFTDNGVQIFKNDIKRLETDIL